MIVAKITLYFTEFYSILKWGYSYGFLKKSDEIGVIFVSQHISDILDWHIFSNQYQLSFFDFFLIDVLQWGGSHFFLE